MSPDLSQVVLTTYYLVLGILALYGTHRLLILALYLRHRRRPLELPSEPEVWPTVTVQLPVFNEMYVAERLVRAVAALDYPRERLEIQVLDDSTDETVDRLAAVVADLRAEGFDIHHVRRSERTGFKAGALAHGLESARGELAAVFDADFVPSPDFLRRTVPWFADAGVGMVQARWEHINREWSLLTRIQAIFLDGHFLVEHFARNRSGRFFNFNGTAGVWRCAAIHEAGGWQHDTLTEDLDLSYRAQLSGWRFVFVPEITAPAELPVEVNAFKRQQYRWAKGSIQTARKLLWPILRSDLPWRLKAEAFVHLTNNAAYLLMLLLSVLIFPAMALRREMEPWALLWIDLPLFLAATVSVLAFYVASQRARGASWWRSVAPLAALMGLGMGLAVNNTRAVLAGLFRDGGTFERTPKYRIEGSRDGWKGKRYRVARNPWLLVEGAMAVWLLVACVLAVDLAMWYSLPFLYLFLQGYWYLFLISLPGIGDRPSRRNAVVAGEATTLP